MFRPQFVYLLCGVWLAGIYYLAARLVFPRNFVEWSDFDVYYFEHKKWVFGGMLACNVVAGTFLSAADEYWSTLLGVLDLLTYFIPLLALLAVRNKRANLALLSFLLAEIRRLSAPRRYGGGY